MQISPNIIKRFVAGVLLIVCTIMLFTLMCALFAASVLLRVLSIVMSMHLVLEKVVRVLVLLS